MKIIGIAGRKGSGKDTFAQPLLKAGWLQLRFADGLKNMLRALLATAGLSQEAIEHYIEQDRDSSIPALCGRTMRHTMQTLGTEWGRSQIADDLWLRIMFERLKMAASVQGANIVITDVRFPNEVEFLRALDGYVVRINRSSVAKTEHDHISEKGVDHLRVNIDMLNDDGIAALHAMALRIADTTGQSQL